MNSKQDLFRLVVDSAPNAMILVDFEGVISLSSREASNLFGYKESEMIGKHLEILIPERYQDGHKDFRKSFFNSLEKRPMGVGRNLYALHKSGREIPVEIGLNPLELNNDMMVLASIIDISERKQQEQLTQRKIELEIKNKELEQFVYLASHDLHEPLRTITNYIQLIREDSNQLTENEIKFYLEIIENATNRMGSQMKALLDYSRLGNASKPGRINCEEIMQEVIEDLDATIKESNAIITFEELPIIHGYKVEFRLLLLNLISNAIKFVKKGVPPVVLIEAEERENDWKFSVIDNGIGINEKYFNRIFQVFQRLHKKNLYRGDGIGLSFCKKIVEIHGGIISVESEMDKGSIFNFTISKYLK